MSELNKENARGIKRVGHRWCYSRGTDKAAQNIPVLGPEG